jgi:hypothetical protein
MASWSARQLAAVGAVAATILFVVGFSIWGSPPSFDADGVKVVGYFHSHHQRVLVSVVLCEIAIAIMVGVIAQLAVLLRDAGQRAHAAVVGIAGAASLGTIGVGIGLWGGLAQLATFGQEAGAVAPLYRLVQFILVAWFWTTLVMVAAVALAAWNGVFARWVAAVDGIIAVLLVLGGISVKGDGALAAGTGPLCTIGSIAFLVWVLHLGVLFWGRAEAVPAAAMSPSG